MATLNSTQNDPRLDTVRRAQLKSAAENLRYAAEQFDELADAPGSFDADSVAALDVGSLSATVREDLAALALLGFGEPEAQVARLAAQM